MLSRSFVKDAKYALLPVGSTEQHGPHLPITTDTLIAVAVANNLAKSIPKSIVLPELPYTLSYEHCGFPGTVSIRTATLGLVVKDIVESLNKQGLICIIVNFHFGNNALGNFVQELNHDGFKVMLAPSTRLLANAYESAGITKTPSEDMHAGEAETSLLLHICPEMVDKDIFDCDMPYRPLLNTIGFKGYTPSGVIGFPSLATKVKGENLLNSLTDLIARDIKEFINATK